MTSPALLVLSLALVCSILGTATEQSADHDNELAMQTVQPTPHLIYDEIDNINMKMRITRTNVYNNYVTDKKYITYDDRNRMEIDKYNEIYSEYKSKRNTGLNENSISNIKDSKRTVDEIYAEYENHKPTNVNKFSMDIFVKSNTKMRQYNGKDKTIGKRVKRDLDPEVACENFKLSVKDNRITHPHDNNEKNYYNNTDCVTVIKAEVHQVIKLTFVDVFHIEETEGCAYDFLEIRDGSKGYAKLLGKLCGQTFPPQIISSGPYLWLKFHSDDTIEYEGFHINVEYVAGASHNIPESCNKTITGMYGNIDSSDLDPDCVSGSMNQALDVVWTIRSPENTKIYLNFTSYALAKPNECEENVIQVFGYELEFDSKLEHYCGSVANPVTTKGDAKGGQGNIMYIRMFASITARKSAFKATYTAFKSLDPTKFEKCEEDEFDCQDNTCIDIALKCDGSANCRLKADEDAGLCEGETQSIINEPHIMVILVIFSLILSGMSFVFLFKCIKKLYQDHKIIKEHIQRSCEDRLDTLMVGDSRFALDAKKLQRESEPRASLERENHTNEMFKQQRKLSQHRKPSSIDSDFIQETHLDLDEEPWRREVDSIPIEAKDIKIERNGRTRRTDSSKREDSIRSKVRESEEHKEKKEIRDASVAAPDTKESGCQTRESLFQAETAPSSEGSGTNSRGFSTFGYSGATIARPSPPAPTNTSEITIELLRQVPQHQESLKPQKKIPDRRPMSTETTRSAPDVIIVSKPIR